MTMIIRPTIIDPSTFQERFGALVGTRMTIRTPDVWTTIPRAKVERQALGSAVTFEATATDAFLEIDGVVNRLFVDVSIDLPSGLKHIWMADGPAIE